MPKRDCPVPRVARMLRPPCWAMASMASCGARPVGMGLRMPGPGSGRCLAGHLSAYEQGVTCVSRGRAGCRRGRLRRKIESQTAGGFHDGIDRAEPVGVLVCRWMAPPIPPGLSAFHDILTLPMAGTRRPMQGDWDETLR